MTTETTTSLDKIHNGVPFTWGEILRLQYVGPYTIATYRDTYDGRALYFGWVDRKSVSESWETLDMALAGLIAYRHEGCNHRADIYFIRGIGADE